MGTSILTTESPVKDLIEHARETGKIQFFELPADESMPYAVAIVGTGAQARTMKLIFQRVVREMNARGAGIIIPELDIKM